MKKKILYCQYTNPAAYPPLIQSSKILAERGWEILFLGTNSFGDSNILQFNSHPQIKMYKLNFNPSKWLQPLQYLYFIFWNIKWAWKWRPQWIYASDPNSCLVALILRLLFKIQIIYHEHDFPLFSKKLSYKFFYWIKKRLIKYTKLVVLPNSGRTLYFTKNICCSNTSVLTVMNCPATHEIILPKPENTQQDIWLFYQGSIGPDRLPLTILTALTTLEKNIKLRIIGYETQGSIGYKNIFLKKAIELGIENRIIIMNAIPSREELLKICRGCDIGLSFMPMVNQDINMQMMAGASNKAFDYLACGLTLIISDLPDWRQMFIEPEVAISCNSDDPHSIASAIQRYVDHPNQIAIMREKALIMTKSIWNYETQFSPVISVLEQFS